MALEVAFVLASDIVPCERLGDPKLVTDED
jgi:hypothetical protein